MDVIKVEKQQGNYIEQMLPYLKHANLLFIFEINSFKISVTQMRT